MIVKFDLDEVLALEEVESTQDVATAIVMDPMSSRYGAVFARDQTCGKGRFERPWFSESGASLTVSLILWDSSGHPAPHLIGMAVAAIAAETFDLNLQWPNDLMLSGKKVGGVLTSIVSNTIGDKAAIVGFGLNLNQLEFPSELDARATSIRCVTGESTTPWEAWSELSLAIHDRPLPLDWQGIARLWMPRDQTAGKSYVDNQGRLIRAKTIGPNGELVGSTESGEAVRVFAADAIFGIGT